MDRNYAKHVGRTARKFIYCPRALRHPLVSMYKSTW